MLGRLLARAVNDVSSQDLHDRALLYHRLLKHDPEVARRVCCCEKPPVSGEFAEDRDTGESRFEKITNVLTKVFARIDRYVGGKVDSMGGLPPLGVSFG